MARVPDIEGAGQGEVDQGSVASGSMSLDLVSLEGPSQLEEASGVALTGNSARVVTQHESNFRIRLTSTDNSPRRGIAVPAIPKAVGKIMLRSFIGAIRSNCDIFASDPTGQPKQYAKWQQGFNLAVPHSGRVYGRNASCKGLLLKYLITLLDLVQCSRRWFASWTLHCALALSGALQDGEQPGTRK